MDDPEALLGGDGEKMRHIKIYQDSAINEKAIMDFVKQALILNKKLYVIKTIGLITYAYSEFKLGKHK